MQRYSYQRELILRNLCSRCDHPTAEMVYEEVRKEIPHISLATVYRNLNNLSDANEILCFTLDGKDHFDGNARPHIHLCCTKCGSIEDRCVDMDELEGLVPGLTRVSNVIIEGICKDCTK